MVSFPPVSPPRPYTPPSPHPFLLLLLLLLLLTPLYTILSHIYLSLLSESNHSEVTGTKMDSHKKVPATSFIKITSWHVTPWNLVELYRASDKPYCFIIRADESFVCQPRWWRGGCSSYLPNRTFICTRLHGFTTQNTAYFISTVVKLPIGRNAECFLWVMNSICG